MIFVGFVFCTILVFFFALGMPIFIGGIILIWTSRLSRRKKVACTLIPLGLLGAFWLVVFIIGSAINVGTR